MLKQAAIPFLLPPQWLQYLCLHPYPHNNLWQKNLEIHLSIYRNKFRAKPLQVSTDISISPPLSELKRTRQNPTLHHQKLPSTQNYQQRKVTPKKALVDNKFIVKVSQGYSALEIFPCAIMLHLNAFLKENLVREVQVAKTRFAIYPTSISVQISLHEHMDAIGGQLLTQGPFKVEKITNHTACMSCSVPRSYTGYNGASLTTIQIIAAQATKFLIDLISIEPISVLQSVGRGVL